MHADKYPTIVSFYTKTWQYEAYRNAMVADCERHQLKHNIQEMQPQPYWFKNTRLKPKFLLKVIAEEQRPILWVDVDATLYTRPKLFELPCDYDLMMKKKPVTHGRQWHVGTIFLDYNERVVQFIKDWISCVDKNPHASDELCLDYMWKAGEMQDMRIASDIPAEYFYMPADGYPQHDTVILHRESKGNDKKLR